MAGALIDSYLILLSHKAAVCSGTLDRSVRI
jgi:hypothetical protein